MALDLISLLLNTILNFCVIPNNFNMSVIKPILKDTRKLGFDVNNLRPISVSNCLSQIFEKIIVKTNPALLNISCNQFGFRKGLSTVHPLFILKEASIWCKNDNTPCYVASLDAEKAFDTLWRAGMIHKIMNKMDKNLWLVLYVYYKSSSGFLKLNGKMVQRRICINRGVKQGGILSSFLFNAFMDSLIVVCKALGIGAHWNELNVSILAYCDDVILIAPSLEQL